MYKNDIELNMQQKRAHSWVSDALARARELKEATNEQEIEELEAEFRKSKCLSHMAHSNWAGQKLRSIGFASKNVN